MSACLCLCVCCHGKTRALPRRRAKERAHVFSASQHPQCSVCYFVCGCVRRQISKNAKWDASPYFQAVDGKQPLGSTGLKQLEKFVEGAQRGNTAQRLSLNPPQEKANPNKLSVIKPNKCYSLRDRSSQTRIVVIKKKKKKK